MKTVPLLEAWWKTPYILLSKNRNSDTDAGRGIKSHDFIGDSSLKLFTMLASSQHSEVRNYNLAELTAIVNRTKFKVDPYLQ